MPTIGDVARRAGVSRSTVSYALSGKRTISQETRDRIDRVIAELGFTPNAGARALATSQTMVLGLLLQFHADEFAPAMLQYVLPVSEAARRLGYDILMITEPDGSRAIRRIGDSEMVDGIVLLVNRANGATQVAFNLDRFELVTSVPEPGPSALLLAGLAVMALRLKRQAR